VAQGWVVMCGCGANRDGSGFVKRGAARGIFPLGISSAESVDVLELDDEDEEIWVVAVFFNEFFMIGG
jgi:hypothetical protein